MLISRVPRVLISSSKVTDHREKKIKEIKSHEQCAVPWLILYLSDFLYKGGQIMLAYSLTLHITNQAQRISN